MTTQPHKICIFGNSHLAALRTGWAAHPDRWPNLSPQFVGAHKGLLLETDVLDGWLRPTTPEATSAFARLGGNDGIDLRAYDAFAISGCMVALSLATSLYRRMHWIGLPSVEKHANLGPASQLLISRAAAVETLAACYANRLGLLFLAKLRAHTEKPIYLISQPRVSADILTIRDPSTQAHRLGHRAGDSPEISSLFEQAAKRAVTGAGGTYLPQPAVTISHDILTHVDYIHGAKRLTASGKVNQPVTDIRHANAHYGALVIDQLSSEFA